MQRVKNFILVIISLHCYLGAMDRATEADSYALARASSTEADSHALARASSTGTSNNKILSKSCGHAGSDLFLGKIQLCVMASNQSI